MNALTRSKVRRRALQKHCKMLEVEITRLLESFKHERILDLKALKHNYQDQIGRLEEVNDDIIQSIDDEELLETEISKSLSEKNSFYTLLSKVDHCLGNVRLLPPVPAADDVPPSQSLSSSSIRPCASPKTPTELPKIILERFDGNILNWQRFWKQFESCVHMQPHFSVLSKVTFLKSLLAPPARECLAGLPLTTDNYKKAIEKLRAKYENTELLIYAHMEAFARLPKVRTTHKIEKLREIMEKLANVVTHLASLRVDTEVYGSFLIPMLLKKLPKDLVVIISRKVGTEKWELVDVLDILEEEIEAIERCSYCKDNNENLQNPTDQHGKKRSNVKGKKVQNKGVKEEQIGERSGKEKDIRRRANDLADINGADKTFSFPNYTGVPEEKELQKIEEEKTDTEDGANKKQQQNKSRARAKQQMKDEEMNLSFAQVVSRQEDQLEDMQFIFKITCPFCHSVRHSASECHIVPDVASRVAVLRERGRCFLCLRTGHVSKDCASSWCCECNERHHESICENTRSNCDDPSSDATEEENVGEETNLKKKPDTENGNDKNAIFERCPSFLGSKKCESPKFRRQTSCPL